MEMKINEPWFVLIIFCAVTPILSVAYSTFKLQKVTQSLL